MEANWTEDRDATVNQAVALFGVSRDRGMRIYREIRRARGLPEPKPPEPKTPEPPDAPTEAEVQAAGLAAVTAARDQLKVLQRQYDHLKLEAGYISNFMDEVVDSVRAIKPPKISYTPSKQNKSNVEAVVQLTDWHWGEVVDPGEVEGSNAYNPDLAKKRVNLLGKKLLNWIQAHRNGFAIDTLRVICTGDFISGDIHHELQVTNAYPAPVQAVESGNALAALVSALSPHFKKVVVDFIIPDNHSRLTRKIQFAQAGLNSFGFVVGKVAELLIRDHPNVIWTNHPEEMRIIDVLGTRYLARHGHNIRGVLGIPYYGFDRAVARQARSRMGKEGRDFHVMLTGHFHCPARMSVAKWDCSWSIGGSLSGTTSFDHSCNRYAPACQTAWMVHPELGEMDYNVFVLP